MNITSIKKKVEDLSVDLDVESKEKKGVKDGSWKDGVAIIWDGKVCDGTGLGRKIRGSVLDKTLKCN